MGSRQSALAPDWERLPPNVLSNVFQHLQAEDKRTLTSVTISGPVFIPNLSALTQLPGLRKLQLGKVELGPRPHFHKLTQLQQLALLEACSTLRVLALVGLHNLEGGPLKAGVPWLSSLTQLEALCIAASLIQGDCEAAGISALTNLRVLDMRESELDCSLQDAFLQLHSLRLLVLDVVSLFKMEDDSLLRREWQYLYVKDFTLPAGHPNRLGDPGLGSPEHPLHLANREFRKIHLTGKSPEKDAADEERLRMFDAFWRAYKLHNGHYLDPSDEDDDHEQADDDETDDEDEYYDYRWDQDIPVPYCYRFP
ncbi:hypothetical protein WJX73_010285 [Symbiochloris irregularis]|uniref:F-box domain-containing protein n=1 Tax=Symbiochloris irregularis TaxID=706552 RepID=A0AAW1NMI1_9CHLO